MMGCSSKPSPVIVSQSGRLVRRWRRNMAATTKVPRHRSAGLGATSPQLSGVAAIGWMTYLMLGLGLEMRAFSAARNRRWIVLRTEPLAVSRPFGDHRTNAKDLI